MEDIFVTLKVKYRANSNFTQSLITPRIIETQILQLSEIFLEFSVNRFHLRFLQNFVVRPNQTLVGEFLDSQQALVCRERFGCLEVNSREMLWLDYFSKSGKTHSASPVTKHE